MPETFSTEEIFSATVETLHRELKDLDEAVNLAEKILGSAYADRPGGDHKSLLNNVLIRRAERDGASRLFRIVMGYRTGQLIPPKKTDQQ